MLRWRRNLTWTKRKSTTIRIWHRNVGQLVCPSIRQRKMSKKCQRGSRILWTPRFLLFILIGLWKKTRDRQTNGWTDVLTYQRTGEPTRPLTKMHSRIKEILAVSVSYLGSQVQNECQIWKARRKRKRGTYWLNQKFSLEGKPNKRIKKMK